MRRNKKNRPDKKSRSFLTNPAVLIFMLSTSFTTQAVAQDPIRPANQDIKEQNVNEKTLISPGLKIRHTIHGVDPFQDAPMYPDHYLWTRKEDTSVTPRNLSIEIFDMKSGQHFTSPDLEKFLPPDPEKPVYEEGSNGDDFRAELSRLKLTGEYWQYRDGSGVPYFYDSKKEIIGLLYSTVHYFKTVEGNPVCPGGSESELIEKYYRYLCWDEKKYIEEEDYIKEVTKQHYVVFDLKDQKIVSQVTFPEDDPGEKFYIVEIGTDTTGKFFYYYYITTEKTHNLNVRAIDLKTGELALFVQVPLPNRKNVQPGTNFSFTRSPDLKKIFFMEYDEYEDPKTPGKLMNPGPMIFVVDLQTGEDFSLPGMLTMYGTAIDRQGKYFVVNSHQTGELIKYDLQTKQPVIKTKVPRQLFAWVLDEKTGYMYGLTMRRIEVYNFTDLKPVKTIKYEDIFPGIKRFISTLGVEHIKVSADGSVFAIGILQQKGDYVSSNMDDGFYIMETAKETAK